LVLNSKQEHTITTDSRIRVLIVDDSVDWRLFTQTKLDQDRTLHVVGVALDGLEAVAKADMLQPDLVLLDIGLPKLNGIAAAGRILKITPESKIVFVSEELDLSVARAALRAGGHGYVAKPYAETDLFAAIESVMLGKVFVSRRLAGHAFADVVDMQTTGLPRREVPSAAPAETGKKIGRCHEVQFYANDASFLDGAAPLIISALEAGDAAIFIGTEPQRASLLRKLREHGVAIRTAMNQGSYLALDTAETLASFMANDMPDPVRFVKVVTSLIVTASKAAMRDQPRVLVCGECPSLLWAQGKSDAAMRLEELWDEMARTYGVDVLCGYHLATFYREDASRIFQKVCELHSAVHSW
jgi:DNA-binding NarL/FixJ family response regulator